MKKQFLPLLNASGSAELLFSKKPMGENPVLNLLPAAVYVCDTAGNIISYNRKAVELWGHRPRKGDTSEKYCGAFKLYTPDGQYLPHNRTPVATSLLDGKPRENLELILEKPDGSKIPVQVNIVPIKDEDRKLLGIINCIYDVSDQKRALDNLKETERKYSELVASLEQKVAEKTNYLQQKNEELKMSEQRYHKMVEEVEDYAIILLDPNGIVQNWNKGAEKIKGYKESEIVGKSFETFYREEDRRKKLPQQLITRAKNEGKAVHEGWRVSKDGTKFWSSAVLTALYNSDHQLIGFTKVTRDLTNQKLAEDRMKAYNQQLEFQNKELEQFAYAASHDMKEPLRKVHFYNSYITDTMAGKLDEKTADYLNRSISAVKRMSELIEDLLTYARTTSNAQRFDVVNLNEVVDEIVLTNKEAFEENGVELKMGKLGTLAAIPFQIRQLMDNIIGNALKYRHPKRKLQINIKSEKLKGFETGFKEAKNEQPYCHISVEDNGIGFNKQYAEKIFEIFQRLDNKSGAQGSGIGLALCKKIVQNHHGFIRAHGQENKGARFDIYLPEHANED